MNTLEVRARNARKRAKLRAKRRGEGSGMCRLSIETCLWTDDYADQEKVLDQAAENVSSWHRGEDGDWSDIDTKLSLIEEARKSNFNRGFRQIIGQEILITGHDVSSHAIEMLEVHGEQCSYWKREIGRRNHTSSRKVHRITVLTVGQDGQEELTRWRDGTEIGVADVIAAVVRMRAQLSNLATL